MKILNPKQIKDFENLVAEAKENLPISTRKYNDCLETIDTLEKKIHDLRTEANDFETGIRGAGLDVTILDYGFYVVIEPLERLLALAKGDKRVLHVKMCNDEFRIECLEMSLSCAMKYVRGEV